MNTFWIWCLMKRLSQQMHWFSAWQPGFDIRTHVNVQERPNCTKLSSHLHTWVAADTLTTALHRLQILRLWVCKSAKQWMSQLIKERLLGEWNEQSKPGFHIPLLTHYSNQLTSQKMGHTQINQWIQPTKEWIDTWRVNSRPVGRNKEWGDLYLNEPKNQWQRANSTSHDKE